jgi:molybdopterin molybdotransferase
VFVRPALLLMMGRRDLARPEVTAELVGDIEGPSDRTMFARVRVWMEHGRWKAKPTGERGSNLISTITAANGLAVIPEGEDFAPAGSEVRVIVFRPMDR